MAVRSLSSTLKTLAICDVVARSPQAMRLADVVRATGDGRAATYQRLRTLVDAGWMEQSEHGAFRLSLRFQLFATRALEQANLGTRVADLLHDIVVESGETASLAVLDGIDAVIVNRVESRQILRADLRIGTRLALDATASGLALTAFASPSDLKRIAALGGRIADETSLAATRKRGYGVFSPNEPGSVSAVAAPIVNGEGYSFAVIAVSGPTTRFDHERCGAIALAAATRFSTQTGRSDA